MDRPNQLIIKSQAQFNWFNNRLRVMGEQGLDVDPETGISRQVIVKGLQAVTYDDLPLKAGMPAPVKMTRKEQAERVESIKIEGKVACYLIRKPTPIFFVASEAIAEKLRQAMPKVKRAEVMTLREAREFMALDGETPKSLRQAAEWWASPAPEEVTQQPQAQPKVQSKPAPKPWDACPDCGGHHDDDEEVFN